MDDSWTTIASTDVTLHRDAAVNAAASSASPPATATAAAAAQAAR